MPTKPPQFDTTAAVYLPSEERLAIQAQQGCEASLEQLVRQLQVPLVQFLLRWTRCHADAEDMAQETFVRAFRNLSQYSPQWRFRTWLFTIAQRVSLNQARRRRHEQATAAALGAIASAEPEAGAALAALESAGSLWDAIGRIVTPEQAAVLWLYYVEELPTVELARVLGRSRVAVKTMLFRARQRLLPHLQLQFAADEHGEGQNNRKKAPRGRKVPAMGVAHV